MRIAVVVVALVIGGWLSFDGARALLRGDYVTTRAGELGPWSRVVSTVGINPRSAGMKWAHIVLGIAWLVSSACFLVGFPNGRLALLGCSFLTLWYLPLGTMLSIAEIVLLFLRAFRDPN
jgi:hypothetical protein